MSRPVPEQPIKLPGGTLNDPANVATTTNPPENRTAARGQR